MEQHFAIAVERGRVTASGEIDLYASTALRRALADAAAAGTDRLEIDLSGVEFMDSSGINELVLAARLHDRVVLSGASANLRRLFEMVGLPAALEVA